MPHYTQTAPYPVVIIGAGPAGLTAGYELVKRGRQVIVFEKDKIVGGIARTEQYKGYRFDIGGHRFFTKIKEVEELWHELLGDEFLARPRLSRIYYEGKFYDYPLKMGNALSNLGLRTSIEVVLSYLHSQIAPYPQEESFEEWVSNRFGKKLFSVFFKTYTEKVWGIPCSEIRAEWAAQRIQGLSLPVAVRNALFYLPNGKVKTLINSFHYPRFGPGQMWEAAQDFINRQGGEVCLNSAVIRVVHDEGRVISVSVQDQQANRAAEISVSGTEFISTMPVTELIRRLDPPAPPDVLAAADNLSYRDFLTVVLIIKQADLFPDNWIYVHEPQVHIGRIQNFKNWSPDMVPDPSTTSLGLEYFCTEGDELWQKTEAELLALGKKEIEELGLARAADVIDGTIVRQPKAYPVYDRTYATHLETIKSYLAGFENLQTIGRNGLHKYNNQDHSMLTALLAARHILDHKETDVWEVNTERSYHEEVRIVSHDVLAADQLGTSYGIDKKKN